MKLGTKKKTVCGFGKVFCWPVDEKEFIQAEPEKQLKKKKTKSKKRLTDVRNNVCNDKTH